VKWLDEISIERNETPNFYQGKQAYSLRERLHSRCLAAIDYKRIEPRDTAELAKLSGEHMDNSYRDVALRNTLPLTIQGPSCAITEPQSGASVQFQQSPNSEQRLVTARGYALGARGMSRGNPHLRHLIPGF
jgi:hypothetical protein